MNSCERNSVMGNHWIIECVLLKKGFMDIKSWYLKFFSSVQKEAKHRAYCELSYVSIILWKWSWIIVKYFIRIGHKRIGSSWTFDIHNNNDWFNEILIFHCFELSSVPLSAFCGQWSTELLVNVSMNRNSNQNNH